MLQSHTKKSDKYIVVFIVIIFVALISCETQKDKEARIKKLICDDNYKFWFQSVDIYELNVFHFVCYSKDGDYRFYSNSKKKKVEGFLIDDIIYPQYWELKNDSIILIKWDKDTFYERKIVQINEDTLITSRQPKNGKELVLDTLVSPPDSIKYLLKNITSARRSVFRGCCTTQKVQDKDNKDG